MTPLPKLLCITREHLINVESHVGGSVFNRPIHPHAFVLKPNVKTAFELLITSELPFVLFSCLPALKDGTMTNENFDTMWETMQVELVPKRFLNIQLPRMCISHGPTKRDLFESVVAARTDLQPHEITVLDESIHECYEAAKLGLNAIQTSDLYRTVCEILDLVP